MDKLLLFTNECLLRKLNNIFVKSSKMFSFVEVILTLNMSSVTKKLKFEFS